MYCQLVGMLEKQIIKTNVAFVFGVREAKDIFYSDEIREIGAKFDNFDYQSYLSRESIDGYQAGYVIDWITPENVSKYQEFYICGSPAMVKSAREKLEALGVV